VKAQEHTIARASRTAAALGLAAVLVLLAGAPALAAGVSVRQISAQAPSAAAAQTPADGDCAGQAAKVPAQETSKTLASAPAQAVDSTQETSKTLASAPEQNADSPQPTSKTLASEAAQAVDSAQETSKTVASLPAKGSASASPGKADESEEEPAEEAQAVEAPAAGQKAAKEQPSAAPKPAPTPAAHFDVSMMQIAVEAMVVEVNETFARDLGVDLVLTPRTDATPDNLELEGSTSKFPLDLDQLPVPVFEPDVGSKLDYGNPRSPGGRVDFLNRGRYGRLKGRVQALLEMGEAEIRTRPIVIALNGTKASIETVDEVPFQDIVFDGKGKAVLQVKYEKVGVKLDITPTIVEPVEKEMITLNLSNIEVSDVSHFITVRQVNRPVFVTSNAQSPKVTLHNGETLVIGGLKSRREVVMENRVPILGRIPLLGWLFKSHHKEIRDIDVLFYVTPYILPPGTNPILPFDFEHREVLYEPLASPQVGSMFEDMDPNEE